MSWSQSLSKHLSVTLSKKTKQNWFYGEDNMLGRIVKVTEDFLHISELYIHPYSVFIFYSISQIECLQLSAYNVPGIVLDARAVL